jgi:hypothetical protein
LPTDPQRIDDLSQTDLVRFILDVIHRSSLHYGFWFSEIRHQMGTARALEALRGAYERSLTIQVNRLAEVLGFELEDGLPKPLLAMDRSRLKSLAEGLALNWLSNDGVWFQAVEFRDGMNDAKRCNDSAWAQFSPLEAWSIKRLLNLPDRPGLDGLRKALQFRIYALINPFTLLEESPESLVLQMNDCRVQSTRKRKGLADYACKSAGVVEYTYFARSIDDRIMTDCVGCPPDPHPDEWYCSWRLTLKTSSVFEKGSLK